MREATRIHCEEPWDMWFAVAHSLEHDLLRNGRLKQS
jgi:hypothetical protein